MSTLRDVVEAAIYYAGGSDEPYWPPHEHQTHNDELAEEEIEIIRRENLAKLKAALYLLGDTYHCPCMGHDPYVDLSTYFNKGTGTEFIYIIDVMQPICAHIKRLEKKLGV